ncbi:hypothetical protein OSTOST_25219, partial [Ostertagia ostertagi]
MITKGLGVLAQVVKDRTSAKGAEGGPQLKWTRIHLLDKLVETPNRVSSVNMGAKETPYRF